MQNLNDTREQNRQAKRRQRLTPGYKEKEKARRDSKKEWAATLRRRQTKEGWAKHILPQLRWRAKSKGLDYDLTAEDLVVPDYCPVLGIPLRLSYEPTSCTKCPPDRPSVDRVDNTKGYTRDNIRVISNRANLLKKDATPQEIERLYLYMKECMPSLQ